MASLEIGKPAPEFNLDSTAESGRTSLADLRGNKVVLFFYIADFTAG